MEETEFLQDLLECSVCLNSLTQQNKVLPCQHTFCCKCLAEILQTQNELRCPECRILYKEIKSLDLLPSNILLIRLLEGLKQNMRVKHSRLAKTPNQTPMKQFGKLSILPHQQTNSLVQRQLMTNKSVLQQLQGNHVQTPPPPLMQQQQYVSPRQLTSASSNGLPTNGHSIVYGNLPQLPSSAHYPIQPQQSSGRRPQLNLENTLVKQSSLTQQDASILPLTNSLQTAPKTVKTPTSSTAPNLPAATHSTLTSPTNLNNLNTSSSINQSTIGSKAVMCNGRALRDSEPIGNWSIKKNEILFIKEQLNAHWYLAIFNCVHLIVPVSFVELINSNSGTGSMLNGKTACKTLAHTYSTLPSSIHSSSLVYQSLTNSNVNSNVHSVNRQPPANAFQQQSIGVQLPLAQQYFTQFTMCRALYDFRVADVNDKNCLSFQKNALITLIRRVDENWLEGSLENSIGIFPINFVDILPTIRPATRSSSQNSGSNPSSTSSAQTVALPAPPIYHSRTHSSSGSSSNRLLNISHSRSNSINNSNSISIVNGNQSIGQQQTSAQLNGGGGGGVHHRCTSSTSNELITNPKLTLFDSNALNHQFGNLDPPSNPPLSGSSSSNSYDNLLDIKSTQPPNLYIALYNYTPQKKDELQLKKNELYLVHEKCLDGWYKGSSVKTNQMGVFPGNYLLPARNNNNGQTSYQNVVANRRSFGNLSTTAKFDSADNLLGTTNGTQLTKPKQLTSSIDNNLSDLNSTMSKLTVNAKSENYLSGQQNGQHKNAQPNTISKSVEQLNNDNSLTYENLSSKNGMKKSDSNHSSTSNSPQWIKPVVVATRSASKQKTHTQNSIVKTTNHPESPYSLVLNGGDLSNELRIEITTNSNNTTHVIKEVINTPIKSQREEKKSVNLIKMFTGKRSNNKIDKHKKFSCDNPTFVDISPKN